MEQYIDKSALVAEIEKRKKYNHERAYLDKSPSMAGREEEDKDILSIIGTLEVKETEEKPASEDFEEIVKGLWDEINTGHEYSVIESYNVFYGLCLDIANWKKEQMIAKAVDGEVGYWNQRGLEEDDKCKVITIKED